MLKVHVHKEYYFRIFSILYMYMICMLLGRFCISFIQIKIDQNCMDGRLPFTRVPIKSTHGRLPSKEKHRLNTVGRYLCNGSNDFLFHHVNLVESRIIGPFTGFGIHGKLLEILIGGIRPKKCLPRNDRN